MQQINHQMFLRFLDMNLNCLAINYHVVMQNPISYILTLEFDYFVISLQGDLHFEEIKIVLKWPRQSIPPVKSSLIP